MTVAIVTDSGSDLTPAQLSAHGIRQVPLSVSIGDRSYLSPDELAPEEFWRLMSAPDSPFAHTAAPSAGQFRKVFEEAFAAGAEGVVCVCLSETLSSTIQSARMGSEMLPGKPIHVVDSRSASMAVGALALRGATMAAAGASAAEIAEALTAMRLQTVFFVALETLDYLRKGGRISPARAAIGGLLSVKPIMTIDDGEVVPADMPRTRAKAHERIVELMTDHPTTELHLLYAPPADAGPFRDQLLARLPSPAPSLVTAQVIGPVIGAHVGPGAYGGVLIREA
jgi:fatty acid kinase fatty acid binding subunit